MAHLYDRYSSVVYAVALRVLTDAAAAEDVLQEIFMQLWRNPGAFDPRRADAVAESGRSDMSVHEQFAEDLALYALGAIEGEERASLEKHLQECASCRRELEHSLGDAALLALTTSGPRPPVRAKSRLL